MIKCKHKNWVAAGYPESRDYELGLITHEEQIVFKVCSIYHVYCTDCNNFVNLLTGKKINNKGLVRIRGGLPCTSQK